MKNPRGLFLKNVSNFLTFQDARKGVLFIDFPPVLQLQLKRFEYDFMRDTMVKVSCRVDPKFLTFMVYLYDSCLCFASFVSMSSGVDVLHKET